MVTGLESQSVFAMTTGGPVPDLSGWPVAVSLHAHTGYSREKLGMLPGLAEGLPVIGAWFRSEMDRLRRDRGRPVNFDRLYWTPPVSPFEVLASETAQLETLGWQARVAPTDHDDVSAGLELVRLGRSVPVSVEWSVPFQGRMAHLGVYNLPPARAEVIMGELAAATARRNPARIADVLAALHEDPGCWRLWPAGCRWWPPMRVGLGTSSMTDAAGGCAATRRGWSKRVGNCLRMRHYAKPWPGPPGFGRRTGRGRQCSTKCRRRGRRQQRAHRYPLDAGAS